MAVVMARNGLAGQAPTGPPDLPVQLELPVLFDGFRPPDRNPICRWRRRRRTHGPSPADRQLDLNLVLTELLEADELADQAAHELDAIEGEVEYESWEEAEVRRLHFFLLDRSLEVLADRRTSASTVLEVLDWMREPKHQPPQGFSFQVCCALAGYDADALLEQVEYEVDCLHGLKAA